ncbi:hypothetical protein B0I37DRAFT_62349 [Chaetomium sp. MPI-CAGE-AT-0009]|nr:hypothetical protein B0I37DRAFT_62349 [Chaetomium sp. MPI-CAGE-AT-0009]
MDSLTINPGLGGLGVLHEGHGAGFLFFSFFFVWVRASPSYRTLTARAGLGDRESGIGDRKQHRETSMALDFDTIFLLGILKRFSLGNHGKQRVTRDETWHLQGYPVHYLSFFLCPLIFFSLFPLETGTQ